MLSTGRSTLVKEAPGQVRRKCEGCGVKFWRYPNRGRGRYCSKSCKHANHTGRPKTVRTDPQDCIVCGQSKPLTDYPLIAGERGLKCTECKRKPTQEQKRRSHLKVKFNITLEDWIAIYEVQHGHCPICDIPLPALQELFKTMSRRDSWKSRNWNTDHCHVTGKVRGITCRQCNMGLGSFADNPDRLRRAASYVERHCSTDHLHTNRLTPEL